MASKAMNLMRLVPKAPRVVNPTRSAFPVRGGHEGPDPNAPKWEQAVRSVLRKDEHVVFAVLAFWVVAITGGNKLLSKPK